jgi:hypothetical protein
MRRITWIPAVMLAALVGACGGGSSTPDANVTPDANLSFPQPSGTVAVNFIVDDSVNKDWKAGELEWKGQLQFDPTTRLGTFSSDWNAATPGWAKLYDDGPWTSGGHEPKGATAGDHKWGVTAFVKPAATDLVFGYGLRDATNADRANGGWVWIGDAGSFTIKSTQDITKEVNVTGMAFPTKGDIDMKLVLDKAHIATSDPPFTTNTIEVKGSAWGWNNKATYDDGTAGGHGDDTASDGQFSFLLSKNVDGTKPPYPGLLKAGDKPEFVYVLDGVEYKVGGDASPTGVTAYVKKSSASTWTKVDVALTAGGAFGKNTTVTVPSL